jgi:hypothetical protein
VLLEAFQGVQPLMLVKEQDPQLYQQLTRPFNVRAESETEDDVSNLCLERMEQMKQQMMSGVTDPQELVASIRPPVSMYEPKQKEKQDWYSRWLDLQSAQEAPMPLRQAAEQMFILHQNMQVQVQMPQAANQGLVQGIGAAAAQAPSALGGAMLQQQQPQPQQDDDSLQIEADHKMQEKDHDHELELKKIESQTQQKVATIQGQSQLQNTELQGENQLENTKQAGVNAVKTAKAKPKPIVRKSA